MTDTSTLRIGFVGVGKMGFPICLRLREAGHPVTVLPSPRSGGRLAPELAAAGCTVLHSPRELAVVTDVLITCLPSSLEVEALFQGKEGFFGDATARPGMLHIDHTSGDPDITRRLALLWRERQGTLVDAALSGTPDLAGEGRIKLLCGGSTADLARVEQISKAYATEFIHAGQTGSGHMLRLIGGLMGYGMAMLSSEAFLLCEAADIGPEKLRAMLTGTGADSRTFQAMAAAEIDGPQSGARRKLSLATVFKDLDTLRAQAKILDCDIPVVSLVTERIRRAAACDTDAVISDLTQSLKTISRDRSKGSNRHDAS